ncbi:packaging subunit 1 [Elephant endotheliotropic herpesvirus 5B]|uniref:DNA packaging tegument protein UL17 n=1 Tax=Elephant endotheliotropic herpesvirus 5 TaxID=768738 RepID=A0A075CZL7_9BETA|nr:DNA packaging tegument protein UL17 [Elephant endotheliotropic herpesvirus 5]AHC02858.1 DNA packaging tegument protein UL17 [Elephant endotheliotropic herpesvirus 5]UVZ35270.1 packaging subunit 1 [Elephant endotheliotropic herpesvirus 5B]
MEIHLFNEVGKRPDGPFMVHVVLTTIRFDLSEADMLFVRSVFLHNKHITPWVRTPFNLKKVDIDMYRYFNFKPEKKGYRHEKIVLNRPVVFFSIPLLPADPLENKLTTETICVCRFTNTRTSEFFDLDFMYEDILRDFPDINDGGHTSRQDDWRHDFFNFGSLTSTTGPSPDMSSVSPGRNNISSGQQQSSAQPASRNNIGDSSANVTPGPLEPPSVVRGVQPNFGNNAQNCNVFKSHTYVSETETWSATDISVLRPLYTTDTVYRILYDRSSFLKPPITQPPYDGLTSCFFIRHDLYRSLRLIGSEVINKFFDRIASDNGMLFQKFLCHVPSDALEIGIPEMIYLSQNVWVSNLDTRSCIIKGVVTNIFKNLKKPCFVETLSDDEYWIDIIDVKHNKIYYGQKIKLAIDQETKLLTYDNSHLKNYEQRAGLSVLYINKDLSCIWSFTGGFAAEFRLDIDTVGNVGALGVVFGAPSAVF